MVYRIFVEKKKEFANEARNLLNEAKTLFGIEGLTDVRIFNRYDAENITEELFNYAVQTVFSEPQVDDTYKTLELPGAECFAVESLPGQFDQRADSASQCIQIISQGERPIVKCAKVYALYGSISEEEKQEIIKYVINPVESRQASFDMPETLKDNYDIPTTVATLDGFNQLTQDELKKFVADYGLAMDADDIAFCQQYFRSEMRDPTITEIRMIDTYWSDHCRHTTFGTIIDKAVFEDAEIQKTWEEYLKVRHELGRDAKPVCLMDIATLAVKYLKKEGKLDKLDESEEINACTVKINVDVDGVSEPWLLLFKNETHNHPTEIEPFGGAATCIGGAIRDPLSGRSYVYAAMRLTGAADPTVPVSETIPGKLPQRKLVTTAAAGYSSYGNQIGLATGIVDEVYHPGYAAKHMEVGAVIAATPAANVRREVPDPGDVVILLGGSTGRDGIGGATGSSKAHNAHSVETCGAEVQKGNAPEERKLQRLFRNGDACRMIKRCNDFGAGGVSVAIGELADGLSIDLNAVPKKYEGLDGTELAISESQERMAVVVEKENVDAFLKLAASENLQACPVAVVTENPRLVMNWNGVKVADISREFLNSNGAEKHIDITVTGSGDITREVSGSFTENYKALAGDLNACSKRELSERFDSTIGAGTVLMPFGGKRQLTPIQAMVHKIPVEKKHTDDVSFMSYGYNPMLSEKSPYHGAYLAVVESVSKLVATGASFEDVYLTFQEYFEKPGADGKRWGKPMAALLGAFRAQLDYGIGAIGGKDSMSGSFEKFDVPPTLISFAVTTGKTKDVVTNEFKKAGHKVILLQPEYGKDGLPVTDSQIALYHKVTGLMREGKVAACYTPTYGGIAEAVMKMAFGNGLGFSFNTSVDVQTLFGYSYGSFIMEVTGDVDGTVIGTVTSDGNFTYGDEQITEEELLGITEAKLDPVYGNIVKKSVDIVKNITYNADSWPSPAVKTAKPKVLIPVFPGTNCEFDTAKALRDAGADPEIIVVKNLNADAIRDSVNYFAKQLKDAQMIFIPGGFSGGDEPDGSGKFITAFFRNASIKEGVTALLDDRDGLMCGVCNGFQALIKLGLVPFGKIIDTDVTCPTLTFNTVARHQSRIAYTRVASTKSPWLSALHTGDILPVPISHGEGRFICSDELLEQLIANGQVATQYVNLDGNAAADLPWNPNGSYLAIEGITSPDGRVFGKMGHTERIAEGLYQNVPGLYDTSMFDSAVKYFK